MTDLLEELHDLLPDEAVTYWDDLTLVAQTPSGTVHVALLDDPALEITREADSHEAVAYSAKAAAVLIDLWLNPEVEVQHFHGCPTPTGRPFDCDYCQERSRTMDGQP